MASFVLDTAKKVADEVLGDEEGGTYGPELETTMAVSTGKPMSSIVVRLSLM